MTRHQSIAHWPDHEATYFHDTAAEANEWVKVLKRHGFGGKGKIFPLSVRVEAITNQTH